MRSLLKNVFASPTMNPPLPSAKIFLYLSSLLPQILRLSVLPTPRTRFYQTSKQ